MVNYPFPELQSEADKVIASLPAPSVAVEADMSQIEAPQKLVDAAVTKWNRIDIVINCVALAVNKPLEEQTLEDWDLLVNINGRGTFLLTKACLPHLTKGSGRIVNIASISARGPPPNQTIYAGTKGMVDSFTKCWYVFSRPIGGQVLIRSAGLRNCLRNTDALSMQSALVRLGRKDSLLLARNR